jgi:glutamine synthetase
VHRLGANEAPPAIISVFLGKQVSATFEKIAESQSEDAIVFDSKTGFKMQGIPSIPELLMDNTDRNRTSPFAFTGNRFEFRAVGSLTNCASAMITLNAAVAEQLAIFKERVDARIAEGFSTEKAIFEEVKILINESRPILFDGNGYSDEWKAEAARRGLDCETSVPLIFDRLLSDSTRKMFNRTGVLNDIELKARTDVNWDMYTKKIQIEARVMGDLALNQIVPIASQYEAMLLDKVYKMSQLNLDTTQDIALIKEISTLTADIQQMVNEMIEARKVANRIVGERAKAIAYHDTVADYLEKIRTCIDRLEMIIDDQMWTLPKYRELLFLR